MPSSHIPLIVFVLLCIGAVVVCINRFAAPYVARGFIMLANVIIVLATIWWLGGEFHLWH